MSMQYTHQIEDHTKQDEFAYRIVRRLDQAINEIPLDIEKRLIEIRMRAMERKLSSRTVKIT